MKIALLVPTTSNSRNEWNNIKDSYLYKILFTSFLETYDKEHTYIFYIGYDSNDRIFSNKNEQDEINKLLLNFDNITCVYHEFIDIKKGHLTKMWNKLADIGYKDNCDYFFQIGDDIFFKTKGFINDCINILQKNNNIGMTGPVNNNKNILTQCFVSKKHIEILGYFFPEEIINWYCDDWYNYLYKPNNFFSLKNHYASNDGGKERYKYTNSNKIKMFAKKLANRDKKKIEEYIHK